MIVIAVGDKLTFYLYSTNGSVIILGAAFDHEVTYYSYSTNAFDTILGAAAARSTTHGFGRLCYRRKCSLDGLVCESLISYGLYSYDWFANPLATHQHECLCICMFAIFLQNLYTCQCTYLHAYISTHACIQMSIIMPTHIFIHIFTLVCQCMCRHECPYT